MADIPTEQELMELCTIAARKAINDTLRHYVPAWNNASIAALQDSDRTLVANVLWLANCYEAIGIANAARYLYGTSTSLTVQNTAHNLQTYPYPRARGHSRRLYVLRSDVTALALLRATNTADPSRHEFSEGQYLFNSHAAK